MPARSAWPSPASRLLISAAASIADLAFWHSLALLSIPTALLAIAPDLTMFTLLRIAQGVFMAAAFALTLAYLGEQCSAKDAAGAFAAYITGNVASNLIGRLVSAGVADHLGLAVNFYVFALLNIAGAVLVFFTLESTAPIVARAGGRSPFCRLGRPSAQWPVARCVRHRILHPVRVHRYVHLRELRSGARPDRPFAHDSGPGLFRVSSLDFHDAPGGTRGAPLWHAAHDVGRARGGGALVCRCCSCPA